MSGGHGDERYGDGCREDRVGRGGKDHNAGGGGADQNRQGAVDATAADHVRRGAHHEQNGGAGPADMFQMQRESGAGGNCGGEAESDSVVQGLVATRRALGIVGLRGLRRRWLSLVGQSIETAQA
jgi:hypothetical protein